MIAPSHLLIALGLMSAIASAATAAPVRYAFGGVLTSAVGDPNVTAGTRFSGTLTLDPTEFSNLGSNPFGSALYHAELMSPMGLPSPQLNTGLTFSAGGNPIYSSFTNLSASILQVPTPIPGVGNPPTDVQFYTVANAADPSPGFASIALATPGGSYNPGLGLPIALSLANYPDATFSLDFRDGTGANTVSYRGTIDTLAPESITTTPEPSALALLALAGLGWWARSRVARPS